MTLDEAIKHAEEVANKKKREKQKWDKWLESDYDHRAAAEKVSCELCAEEHKQLAEWLKELKQLREQEPCEDAISRQAALGCCRNEWEEEVEMRLKSLPSVIPQQKTGHWILIDKGLSRYKCSECGEVIKLYKKSKILNLEKDETLSDYPFSNCGAKMIDPQERSGEE